MKQAINIARAPHPGTVRPSVLIVAYRLNANATIGHQHPTNSIYRPKLVSTNESINGTHAAIANEIHPAITADNRGFGSARP